MHVRRKSTNYEGQRSCIIVPAPSVGNQSYETVYKHLTALVASLFIPEVTSQRPLGSNRGIRQLSCSAHTIILQLLISLYDTTKDHGKASKTMGGRCKGMDKAEMKLKLIALFCGRAWPVVRRSFYSVFDVSNCNHGLFSSKIFMKTLNWSPILKHPVQHTKC